MPIRSAQDVCSPSGKEDILYLRMLYLTSIFQRIDMIALYNARGRVRKLKESSLTCAKYYVYFDVAASQYLTMIPIFEFTVRGVVLLLNFVLSENIIISDEDIRRIFKLEEYVDEGNRNWHLTFEGKVRQWCQKVGVRHI